MKDMPEYGDPKWQEWFDRQCYQYWQAKYADAVIELKELETNLKKSEKKPTFEEGMKLYELRRDIEDGELILKHLKEAGKGVNQ